MLDDDFLKLLGNLRTSIERYKRYVDDITIILRAIKGGCSYTVTKKEMVYKEVTQLYLQQTQDEDDEYTFKILKQISYKRYARQYAYELPEVLFILYKRYFISFMP